MHFLRLPVPPQNRRSMEKTTETFRLTLAALALACAGSVFADNITATLVHTASCSAKSPANNTLDAAEELFKQNAGRLSNSGMAYAEFSFTIPAGHTVASATLEFTLRSADAKDRTANVYMLPVASAIDYGKLGNKEAQTYIVGGGEIGSKSIAANSSGNFTLDVKAALDTVATRQNYAIFKFAQASTAASIYLAGKGSDNAPKLTIVTVPPSALTVSVGDDGMATCCPAEALDFSSATGIRAYKAAVSGSTVRLTKVSSVAKGEGVLLVSAGGNAATEKVPVLASGCEKAADNAFVGTLSDMTVNETYGGNTNYVLSKEGGAVGFYKASTTGTKVSAGKAYLPVATGSGAKTMQMSFSGETTGLFSAKGNAARSRYYTLQGTLSTRPSKGIYILDGKKVAVR